MQSGGVVAMHDKRVSCAGDFRRRRLGCFVEIPLLGIAFKLIRCLVRTCRRELLRWGFRDLAFGVNGGCISRNRFPRISVLSYALGNGKKVELPGEAISAYATPIHTESK